MDVHYHNSCTIDQVCSSMRTPVFMCIARHMWHDASGVWRVPLLRVMWYVMWYTMLHVLSVCVVGVFEHMYEILLTIRASGFTIAPNDVPLRAGVTYTGKVARR